jgi:hypothetical protein
MHRRSVISSSFKTLGIFTGFGFLSHSLKASIYFSFFSLLAGKFSYFLTFNCLQTSHCQAYPSLYIPLLVLQPPFQRINVFCTPTPCFPIRKMNFLMSYTILFLYFSSFPHYRALPEKRTVTEVVEKLLALYGSRRLINVFIRVNHVSLS